ncbi:hypothetical protein ABVT39_003097, partial [Epinephelus coioides]
MKGEKIKKEGKRRDRGEDVEDVGAMKHGVGKRDANIRGREERLKREKRKLAKSRGSKA